MLGASRVTVPPLARASQGEKALTRWSMFSSNSKFEDAFEAFSKAANHYKVAKKCACFKRDRERHRSRLSALHVSAGADHEAAQAYIKCAECQVRRISSGDAHPLVFYHRTVFRAQTKLKATGEAASCYLEAAKAYKRVDPAGPWPCGAPVTHRRRADGACAQLASRTIRRPSLCTPSRAASRPQPR